VGYHVISRVPKPSLASVEIPIFAPLREVFEAALADRVAGATFVFPEAARMVKANPDGLAGLNTGLACAAGDVGDAGAFGGRADGGLPAGDRS
jgi:hypothetical protein